MNILNLIGRNAPLFQEDINLLDGDLIREVSKGRFLVIGAAGSIGQAVTREHLNVTQRHFTLVYISENNMVELVRDLRSTVGYGSGEFKTFSLDCGSSEFEALVKDEGPYDYVFNLSALKYVRSESDPYTLMRMIMVNVLYSQNFANGKGNGR